MPYAKMNPKSSQTAQMVRIMSMSIGFCSYDLANPLKSAKDALKPEHNEYREKLEQAEFHIIALKKQMIDIAMEANRRHSELQTKLQTFEGVYKLHSSNTN